MPSYGVMTPSLADNQSFMFIMMGYICHLLDVRTANTVGRGGGGGLREGEGGRETPLLSNMLIRHQLDNKITQVRYTERQKQS